MSQRSFTCKHKEGVHLIASVSQAKVYSILNSAHCLFICLTTYVDYESIIIIICIYLFIFIG